MERNYLLIDRSFSQSQVVGKKFCFFHHPSLSDVELRKIEFHQEDMKMDIQEKQLHTKERASDFNLDLPNEIALDDPINEEDKSPLQSHEFSFSSQDVSLGKLGSSPLGLCPLRWVDLRESKHQGHIVRIWRFLNLSTTQSRKGSM